LFSVARPHPAPHPFPTRRSSDLELTSPADAVKLEVLNSAGRVVDTVQLGASTSGRHSFEWDRTKFGTDTNLTFKVTATSGATTLDRKSTRLNSSHVAISYAVFCL